MAEVNPRNAARPPATIGVVVCSYKRTESLGACLEGLARQSRPPDDLVVVVRDDDQDTIGFIEAYRNASAPIRVVRMFEPGVVAARTAGLRTNGCDVVAMIDDDAVPRPDWIERIFDHFAKDPGLGALGGRDQCFTDGAPQAATKDVVGRLLWNGKFVGNHALGRGEARRVDLLKGANMSFRAEAVAAMSFDARLRGRGAQPCEDLAISLALRDRGWGVVYDPAVLVDHYEGARDEVRHYAGQGSADWSGFSDSVYNQLVAVWDSLSPGRRVLSMVYFALVGTRATPGLVQAIRFTPALGWRSWMRFFVAQKTRLAAYRDLRKLSAP